MFVLLSFRLLWEIWQNNYLSNLWKKNFVTTIYNSYLVINKCSRIAILTFDPTLITITMSVNMKIFFKQHALSMRTREKVINLTKLTLILEFR